MQGFDAASDVEAVCARQRTLTAGQKYDYESHQRRHRGPADAWLPANLVKRPLAGLRCATSRTLRSKMRARSSSRLRLRLRCTKVLAAGVLSVARSCVGR